MWPFKKMKPVTESDIARIYAEILLKNQRETELWNAWYAERSSLFLEPIVTSEMSGCPATMTHVISEDGYRDFEDYMRGKQ